MFRTTTGFVVIIVDVVCDDILGCDELAIFLFCTLVPVVGKIT